MKEDLYKFIDNFRKNQINKIIFNHRKKYIKNNNISNISENNILSQENDHIDVNYKMDYHIKYNK